MRAAQVKEQQIAWNELYEELRLVTAPSGWTFRLSGKERQGLLLMHSRATCRLITAPVSGASLSLVLMYFFLRPENTPYPPKPDERD